MSACHIRHCSLSLPPPPPPLSISHLTRQVQGGGHWSLCQCCLQRLGKTVSIRQGGECCREIIFLSQLPLLAHPVSSPPLPLFCLLSPPHLSSISRRMRQDQGGGCEASAGATCNARAELSVFGKGGGCCKKLSACHIRHCSLSVPPPPPFLSISHPTRQAQCGGYWSFCWCCLQRLGKTVSIRQGWGVLPQNYLPITPAVARSPRHLPSPPLFCLLSHAPGSRRRILSPC